MATTNTLLLLVALMQVKHLLADFYFQTLWMLTGRENYLHAGRATHAAIHSALSVLVLAAFGTPIKWLVILAVAEWVVHFHIDYWKARENVEKCLTPEDAKFWRAMGLDQLLHQLTYVAMVWVWATYVV